MVVSHWVELSGDYKQYYLKNMIKKYIDGKISDS